MNECTDFLSYYWNKSQSSVENGSSVLPPAYRTTASSSSPPLTTGWQHPHSVSYINIGLCKIWKRSFSLAWTLLFFPVPVLASNPWTGISLHCGTRRCFVTLPALWLSLASDTDCPLMLKAKVGRFHKALRTMKYLCVSGLTVLWQLSGSTDNWEVLFVYNGAGWRKQFFEAVIIGKSHF